jgi:hypothetical protein
MLIDSSYLWVVKTHSHNHFYVKSVLAPDNCKQSVEFGSQFQPVHVYLFSNAVVLRRQHAMQLLHTTAATLDIDISASAFQFAWAISETVHSVIYIHCSVYYWD